ncbi:hypothetical protein M5F66_01850 [Acinetobacter sp. ANC 5033]|uniref:hypothetical protein n=1 Tax=Acinetobacter amyesii TaxID=2942470 RepID=UPI00201B5293|nr:hypothetical protein [Acinetobacter amyesii]MCL6237098.1 hypothetical protein [Acinetobacter amyesii]
MSEIVYISTNLGTACKECEQWIDGSKDFEGSVNHYLIKHSYKIEHIGSETIEGSDGKPWLTTVAVLSK